MEKFIFAKKNDASSLNSREKKLLDIIRKSLSDEWICGIVKASIVYETDDSYHSLYLFFVSINSGIIIANVGWLEKPDKQLPDFFNTEQKLNLSINTLEKFCSSMEKDFVSKNVVRPAIGNKNFQLFPILIFPDIEQNSFNSYEISLPAVIKDDLDSIVSGINDFENILMSKLSIRDLG